MDLDPIIVTTTSDLRENLEQIATTLVERRLAACVQISGPITSHYRWQGQIEMGQEWRCTIKTTRRVYKQLEKVIRELHNYDEPQIIAVPIVEGSPGYLDWIDEQTS